MDFYYSFPDNWEENPTSYGCILSFLSWAWEEEATSVVVEEVLPNTLKDPSPTLIIARMLGNLEAEVEVAKSESGEDGNRSTNVPAEDVDKDRGQEGDQE